jgi:hypothetical protein
MVSRGFKFMKICPYCGKEYADEVVSCSLDGNTLVASTRRKPEPTDTPGAEYQSAKPGAHAKPGVGNGLLKTLCIVFGAGFTVWGGLGVPSLFFLSSAGHPQSGGTWFVGIMVLVGGILLLRKARSL